MIPSTIWCGLYVTEYGGVLKLYMMPVLLYRYRYVLRSHGRGFSFSTEDFDDSVVPRSYNMALHHVVSKTTDSRASMILLLENTPYHTQYFFVISRVWRGLLYSMSPADNCGTPPGSHVHFYMIHGKFCERIWQRPAYQIFVFNAWCLSDWVLTVVFAYSLRISGFIVLIYWNACWPCNLTQV